MELEAARRLAVDLMAEWGLTDAGWEFGFDRAKARYGRCNYTKKRITISSHLTLLNTAEQVEDTIRHEIAHALLPKEAPAHGQAWKAKAVEVGARPERCGSGRVVVGKWQAVCGCGFLWHRHHRPAAHLYYTCNRCESVLEYRKAS